MTKTTRTCDLDGCDNKHVARGLCGTHYNRKHQTATQRHPKVDRACSHCGALSRKRLEIKREFQFCSLICRDLWRHEAGVNPEPPRTSCRLPSDHPVRQLIRANAARKGPIRIALELEDWPALMAALEALCVKVDDCWLWPRKSSDGYGRMRVASKSYGTRRLMMLAVREGNLDSSMPVHHKCAESLCCNPHHLQVVTPQENVAEMLERHHYLRRIAALEAALASVAPHHPLISRGAYAAA